MDESLIKDMRWFMDQFDYGRKRAAAMSTNISQEFERSIYMVPKRFKDVNANAYMPKLVSLGPYHHGRPHLRPMEEHKAWACARFLQRLGKSSSAVAPEDVMSAMQSVVDLLLDAYGEMVEDEEINKEEFLWLMIVDGCFVLEVMFWPELSNPDMDSVFENMERELVIEDIKRDMMLLENQLPLLALYTLAAFRGLEIWLVNSTIAIFYGFLPINKESRYLHILDLYRKHVIEHGKYIPSYFKKPPSVTELSYTGISFHKSKTHGLRDIRISDRMLQLPQLNINDATESLLLNLMCFERMHPVVGNEVLAYAFFMESIIYTSEDVTLLRKKGIINGWLGNDDKVLNMFKQIIKEHTLVWIVEHFQNYDSLCKYDVSTKLNDHYEKVLIKFCVNFIRTFWKYPISFSTFCLGVVTILVLTLIK